MIRMVIDGFQKSDVTANHVRRHLQKYIRFRYQSVQVRIEWYLLTKRGVLGLRLRTTCHQWWKQ